MSFPRRIRTIYGKELIDILRDRRTLIAMIVVPIVLYPLLMLGSIQAVSYQAESMQHEAIVIGVVSEQQGRMLQTLIRRDAEALERDTLKRDALEREQEKHPFHFGDAEEAEAQEKKDAPPTPLADRVDVRVAQSRELLEQRIRDRVMHVGVVFRGDALIDAAEQRNEIEILADPEEVRSEHALREIQGMIDRVRARKVEERKANAGLHELFDQPFKIEVVDLSAPPSILGQILPLILILMTITGAIYPAIDLTAGERERGTLESLMVCPVPVIDLIVGKFLVVTTVAIMGAALNLGSVTATVYFGGFQKVIASTGDALPLVKMVFILLCLIPFAVLMSAIMIAVCSYARTFKEAQNYVTPVILAVLIPGGIAALPATRLEGVMLVMPVGNMVLLARDLLLGAVIPVWQVGLVLLSTTLYAGAAVAVAANIFGKESVVFADAGSLKTMLNRTFIKPSMRPTISMSLLFVALLFPTWFFVQSAFSPGPDEDAARLLRATGWLMPLLFVLLPGVILIYWKVDLCESWALRAPSFRFLLAGVLIGLSAWVPAHEVSVLQAALLGTPQIVQQNAEILAKTLAALPVAAVFLLIAVIPALSEELLFRGFLLGGLSASARKWTAILASAAIFGVFHFFFFKFAVTAGLGVVLSYLCVQSRSIWPGVAVHLLHNSIGALSVVATTWPRLLGIPEDAERAHLPVPVIAVGVALFIVGLAIARREAGSLLKKSVGQAF